MGPLLLQCDLRGRKTAAKGHAVASSASWVSNPLLLITLCGLAVMTILQAVHDTSAGDEGSGLGQAKRHYPYPCTPQPGKDDAPILNAGLRGLGILQQGRDAASPAQASFDDDLGAQYLAAAFGEEDFRFEKKRIVPGKEKWRLCAAIPEYASKQALQSASDADKAAVMIRLAEESAVSGSKEMGVPESPGGPGGPLPDSALCPTASFFVVHQKTSHTDGVVAFLQAAEQHAMDLVSAVVSTTLNDAYAHLGGTCALRPKDTKEQHNADGCFATAGHFSQQQRDSKKLVFLDIGGNHGFFSLFALGSAPFLTALAFEPQPECHLYMSMAMLLSGLAQRSHVFNAMAGGDSTHHSAAGTSKALHGGQFLVNIPRPSKETVSIPVRTGCRGTFPSISAQELLNVKQHYTQTLGLDPTEIKAEVGYVNPAKVLADDSNTVVLFAKVDVEGFEDEVLEALAPMMERGQIANLFIEINKVQRLRRMGNHTDQQLAGFEVLHEPAIVEWVVRILKQLQSYGYVLVPFWTGLRNHGALPFNDDEALRRFADAGFNSADIWAYLPASRVMGLGRH